MVIIVPFVLQIVGIVGIVGYLSFHNGKATVNDLVSQLMEKVNQQISTELKTYQEKFKTFNDIKKTDGLETIDKTLKYLPDLILLDLRMPNLDGEKTAKFLKENPKTKHIPIIIITASLLQGEEETLTKLCEGFLRKPVSRGELVSKLKEIFPESISTNFNTDVSSDNLEETIISKANNLEDRDKLINLLQDLKGEKDNWQKLSQTMIRRDLKKFAQKLTDLAEVYHYNPLKNYAMLLTNQLQELDLENLATTMEQFATIINELEKNIS